MWIVNKYGVAINTDCVARFRPSGEGTIVADLVGMPPIIATQIIGGTTVDEIIRNIISGTPVLEVQ